MVVARKATGERTIPLVLEVKGVLQAIRNVGRVSGAKHWVDENTVQEIDLRANNSQGKKAEGVVG